MAMNDYCMMAEAARVGEIQVKKVSPEIVQAAELSRSAIQYIKSGQRATAYLNLTASLERLSGADRTNEWLYQSALARYRLALIEMGWKKLDSARHLLAQSCELLLAPKRKTNKFKRLHLACIVQLYRICNELDERHELISNMTQQIKLLRPRANGPSRFVLGQMFHELASQHFDLGQFESAIKASQRARKLLETDDSDWGRLVYLSDSWYLEACARDCLQQNVRANRAQEKAAQILFSSDAPIPLDLQGYINRQRSSVGQDFPSLRERPRFDDAPWKPHERALQDTALPLSVFIDCPADTHEQIWFAIRTGFDRWRMGALQFFEFVDSKENAVVHFRLVNRQADATTNANDDNFAVVDHIEDRRIMTITVCYPVPSASPWPFSESKIDDDILPDEYTWIPWTPPSKKCLRKISHLVAHEAGHALGLGHSLGAFSLMSGTKKHYSETPSRRDARRVVLRFNRLANDKQKEAHTRHALFK